MALKLKFKSPSLPELRALPFVRLFLDKARLFLDEVRRILGILGRAIVRTAGAIALFAVFLATAFAAMRIAIHGREVTVPNLANLTDADAAETLRKLGLNLSVENRFYAASVPVNHVLSQSPAPGSRVRGGWQIRVTESLGVQQVPVPDLTGQPEEPAQGMIRHLQLEIGSIAHIPAPSPAGVILAQSPPPNVPGLDGPRVALLVSEDEDPPASPSYVMPSLIGLTVAEANQRLATAGLHLATATAPQPAPDDTIPDATLPPPPLARPVPRAAAQIASQTPLPGRRVSRADNIRVAVGY